MRDPVELRNLTRILMSNLFAAALSEAYHFHRVVGEEALHVLSDVLMEHFDLECEIDNPHVFAFIHGCRAKRPAGLLISTAPRPMAPQAMSYRTGGLWTAQLFKVGANDAVAGSSEGAAFRSETQDRLLRL